MSFVRIASQSRDHAACIVLPVRRVQPGERRHEVHAAVVVHRPGERLDLRALPDQSEIVADPLHQCARDRDAAFESVEGALPLELIRDRGEQSEARLHRHFAHVHQQETAGAVGVLGLADLEAGLADERGLLVTEDARDRHSLHGFQVRLAVRLARRPDCGQHGAGDAERAEQVRVPVELLQVHQLSAAGVGAVGDVEPAGQMPDQKGVDGAED